MSPTEWWEALSSLQKMFLYIGIPATVLLLIQTILTFIGADGHSEGDGGFDSADGDTDGDFDSDGHGDSDGDGGGPLHLFTVRNFIAFFSIFGWSGYAMSEGGSGTGLSISVAVILGAVAMILMALFFRMMIKLQSQGDTFSLKEAVGKTGEIFIPVPAEMDGYGKVNVVVRGIKRELKAVTEGEKLPTGATVSITGVSNDRLIVGKGI